tara:strand:+ start:1309 stop:1707 length:399 start_codon:yes stop_codon:yes gene_type:complete
LIFKRIKKQAIMSIVFYHNNLKSQIDAVKPFCYQKLSKTKDIRYFKDIGSKLILDGFKQGYDVKKQIQVYIAAINTYQKTKLYKLSEADKEYYISCILALWKLDILDPDNPTDPIYIAPLKKRKKKFNFREK